jgi:hypothetical protein
MLYSEELGINLKKDNDTEVFKWFLASLLFGAPIRENSAKKAFNVLVDAHVCTPKDILKKKWNGLVELLDKGSYTRYDFKTADKLLEMAKNLYNYYNSSLTTLYKSCSSQEELEHKLMGLAKGIGHTTVNIFLREMSSIWRVKPEHSKIAVKTAKWLHIKLGSFDPRLETALIRYAHSHKKRGYYGS